MDAAQTPVRAPTRDDRRALRPIYVVWEITLACNLRCTHCGSRAGAPRKDELTTAECVSLIEQLHDLGTREITLIGGEAYLRRDWLTLVRAIANRGMLCGLQTGGRALTPKKIRDAAEAGLKSAGVSIDGLPDVHDRLRGVRGSFATALAALRNFREHGLSATVNTQINTLNVAQLRELMQVIIEAGATGWQVQLTVPMGQAADRPDLILQPYRLLELMPLLAELFVEGQRHGLRLLPGNNIGYFGPYEAFWRSITGEIEFYGGCNAGRTGLGIEADGSIKGCPSLPTNAYVGGNVRTAPLRDIWERSREIAFTRNADDNRARLWGFCGTCYYGDFCQAGCNWTTHVLSGRPGNNPFCHYRALKLAERGWRERIVQRQAAEGRPFDHGLFDIVVEHASGAAMTQDVFERPSPALPADPKGPGNLELCFDCGQFVREGSTRCPHCGGDRKDPHGSWREGADVYADTAARLARFERASRDLERTIARLQTPARPGAATSSTVHASASTREERTIL
jgi:radical SAM protein with 4Fe4S-binding SPASM domain